VGFIANCKMTHSQFTISDPRVGDITIGFEEWQCCSAYPWPGKLFLIQDTYEQPPVPGSSKDPRQVFIGSLAPQTGVKSLQTTDCHGNNEEVNVAVEIEYSKDNYEYAIAFPWIGVAHDCSWGGS
jgi:hypothetical protein